MNESRKLHVFLILALLVIFGVEIGYIIHKQKSKVEEPVVIDTDLKIDQNANDNQDQKSGIIKFSDENDFKSYLAKSSDSQSYSSGFGGGMNQRMEKSVTMDLAVPTATGMGSSEGSATIERISETNVQVSGIDEPDMVKTNGKELFLSSAFFNIYYDMPMVKQMAGQESIVGPNYNRGVTKVIDIFPVAKLAMNKNIEVNGDMLLEGNVLMVFATDGVYAYDVTVPDKPVEKWTLKYENENRMLSARLYNKKVYLITQSYINQGTPCPITPYSIGETKISLSCADIYHPAMITPVDTTYIVSTIDVASGKVGQTISVVGSSNDAEFYMSQNALYLAYYTVSDELKMITRFLGENSDIFPAEIIAKLNKVASYDLSNNAKMTEYGTVMDQYYHSLNADDRLKLENDMDNRFETFVKKYVRDFESTNIVKIDSQDLTIVADGNVPGRLLNQFSMDEYNKNLRVATTSGGRGKYVSSTASINDVYVLDNDLKQIGSVKDMGEQERIYSVRFVGPRGYVVTFRETDPFYVLDLSKPSAPVKTGELKIPGYSSYLHPISENLILGIGKENENVKMSLFNVADPKNPVEVAKYSLKEYWSEVLNTHHAFLLDAKNKVFFMPGSTGAYIFSYSDKEMKLVKAVSNISAERAIFVNDYLYVIGRDKIAVLDEKKWEKVKELTIK